METHPLPKDTSGAGPVCQGLQPCRIPPPGRCFPSCNLNPVLVTRFLNELDAGRPRSSANIVFFHSGNGTPWYMIIICLHMGTSSWWHGLGINAQACLPPKYVSCSPWSTVLFPSPQKHVFLIHICHTYAR